MDLRTAQAPKRMARAPAKLNLYLNVLGRRDDGFHELETLMVPIRLYDSLTFQPVFVERAGCLAPIQLSVVDNRIQGGEAASTTVPTDSGNLVVRALETFRLRSGVEHGASVELVKRIPVAAGLGGGSSDAAAALRLANLGWQINWRVERLAKVAAEIGSDVAFFLYGGAGCGRGRGELIERLPAAAPLHFVVVKPPIGLSTGEVYLKYAAMISAKDENRRRPPIGVADMIRHMAAGNLRLWVKGMQNSLQAAASALSPWVERVRKAFDRLGFLGHQLSGSGSAYFGVCRHAQQARRLATILRTWQLGLVYATRSCH